MYYEPKTVKMTGFSGRDEDVVPARERILALKSLGIPYSISTYPVEIKEKLLFKATLDVCGNTYHGHSALRDDNDYEACETRSIGRALAAYGIGIENSYASADEIPEQRIDPDAVNSVAESMDKLKEIVAAKAEAAADEKVRQRTSRKLQTAVEPQLKPEAGIQNPETVGPVAPQNIPTTLKEASKEDAEAEKKAITAQPALISDSQQVEEVKSPEPTPPPAPVAEQPKPEPPKQEPTRPVVKQQPKETAEGEPEWAKHISDIGEGETRDFMDYMPAVSALTAAGIEMEDVSKQIEKSGLLDYVSTDQKSDNWELLFENAPKQLIIQVALAAKE